jgi:hypothetical protein
VCLPTEWLLDTGATHHMTPQKRCLRDYKELLSGMRVYLGNNHSLTAIGIRDLHMTLPSGASVSISNVYHIVGLRRNILSVTTATMSESSIEFLHDSCIIHFKLPNGEFDVIKLPQRDRCCVYPRIRSIGRDHGGPGPRCTKGRRATCCV